MKNYSFSNINSEDTYLPRKSQEFPSHRHSELKTSEANQRIEEIKKKYDTPNRRQRIQSMKRSKDVELRGVRKENDKENAYLSKDTAAFSHNYLKESIIATRLDRSSFKKDIDGIQLAQLRSNDQERRVANPLQEDKTAYRTNNRLEEQQIFSKVRQMKESLLHNSDRMKASVMGKSYLTGKYPTSSDPNKDYDPRVENIDKINNKIKQILSCLNQNEKNHKFNPGTSSYHEDLGSNRDSVGVNRENIGLNRETSISSFGNSNPPLPKIKNVVQTNTRRSYQQHFHRRSDVLQKINLLEPKTPQENTEKIEINTNPQQNTREEPRKNKFEDVPRRDWQQMRRGYSATPVQPRNKESASTPYRQDNIYKTPGYLARQPQSKTCKEQRSKSQITSIRKSALVTDSDTLKSGKKLNDEISRIQKKIQQFQTAKRKLNIQFTPFTHTRELSNTKSVSNLNGPSRQVNRDSYSIHKFKQASFGEGPIKATPSVFRPQQSNLNVNPVFSIQASKASFAYNQSNVFESKVQPQDQVFNDPYSIKTFRIEKPEQNEEFSLNQSIVQYDEESIKKTTNEGIQQRKKRLQITQEIITTQSVKRLVELFCMQVKHDETLRNLKIWFESCLQPGKFSTIAKLLQSQGVTLSQKECQVAFTVNESENNPFFSAQSFEGTIEALVSAYLQAMAHWETNIQHKFERSGLVGQGFSSNKVDLEKKGFIQLQDIVRFINIESGTFYRNRDIFLIFQRFTRQEKVNFEDVLREICA